MFAVNKSQSYMHIFINNESIIISDSFLYYFVVNVLDCENSCYNNLKKKNVSKH